MMIQSKFNHFSNIMYKWILSYMLHACRMGILVQGHITGFHYQHSPTLQSTSCSKYI